MSLNKTVCLDFYIRKTMTISGFSKGAMTDTQGATSSKGAMSSRGATGGPGGPGGHKFKLILDIVELLLSSR